MIPHFGIDAAIFKPVRRFSAEKQAGVMPLGFCAPLSPAPVFVLGMSACRHVTVFLCKLTIYGRAQSQDVECAAPKNLEFLPEDLRAEWADGGAARRAAHGPTRVLKEPLSRVGEVGLLARCGRFNHVNDLKQNKNRNNQDYQRLGAHLSSHFEG